MKKLFTKQEIVGNKGLNVKCIFDTSQELKTINLLNKLTDLVYYRTAYGSYEGANELTVIAACNIEKHNLQSIIEKLCIDLNQECIAVKLEVNDNYQGLIIYNPFAKNCKKLQFSEEYFINITYTGLLPQNCGFSMSAQS